MTDSNYIKVFSGTFIIVQLAVERLENVGINAVIKEESGLGQHSGFSSASSGYQELYISTEELDKAIPIIEAMRTELGI